MACVCTWNDIIQDSRLSSVLWPGDATLFSYDCETLEKIAKGVFWGWKFNPMKRSFEKASGDKNSESNETNESVAVKSIARKNIHPSVLYTFWIQPSNLVNFTKPFYGQNCSFPLGVIVPAVLARRKKSEFESFIACMSGQKPENVENYVLHNLCIGLNTLNQLLSENLYFNGETPGDIDAYVYSVLASLMLTVNKLQWKKAGHYALEYQKLVDYVDRISSEIAANSIEAAVSLPNDGRILSVPTLMNFSLVALTISLIMGYCGWAKILVKSDIRKMISIKLPKFQK